MPVEPLIGDLDYLVHVRNTFSITYDVKDMLENWYIFKV